MRRSVNSMGIAVLLVAVSGCAALHRSEWFKSDYYYIIQAAGEEAEGKLFPSPQERWRDFFDLLRRDTVLRNEQKALLYDHAQQQRAKHGLKSLEEFGITKSWILSRDN